jgi:CelD/BcsL family acetyltransferase involved in cellulose biosynthesis
MTRSAASCSSAGGCASSCCASAAVRSSIRAAIDEGLAEFDLLHGDERYKFLWTRRSRPIAALELYPPTLSGALSRAARDGYRAFKSLVRRPAAGHSVDAAVDADAVVPSSR